MYDFKFADIGEGIHEGVILEWMVEIGETIEEGETIVVIETDKVNAEIPSPVSGLVTKRPKNIGETIHVGETIIVIDDGNKDSNAKQTLTEQSEEQSAGVVGEIEVSEEVIEPPKQSEVLKHNNQKVLATPVARKLAKDLNIDILSIVGTGENGRIMKQDIFNKKNELDTLSNQKQQNHVLNTPSISVDEQRVERVKISKIRQTIAENMTISKTTIPHTTVMDEVIIEELVTLRNQYKNIKEDEDISLTYLPFIIKALTKTLKDHRIFNSSFDHTSNEIIYKNYMNIGIAVDTKDGLIVPNIKNANNYGIIELAKELKQIKNKAENKKFTLQDLQDGTISITNYGIFDSTFGAPVIKYPEVAIIGIGKISKKPVVINDEIVIKHVLPLSLSIDHRVIDGGDAGRFLQTFKQYLQQPMLLLLS
jgi:pyruvate dehydrogenase E2 component (dihydrolipoamide acetyltransferase)